MAAASASETVNITEAWGRGCRPASDVSGVSDSEHSKHDVMSSYRWWSQADLKSTTNQIWPEGLAEMLIDAGAWKSVALIDLPVLPRFRIKKYVSRAGRCRYYRAMYSFRRSAATSQAR